MKKLAALLTSLAAAALIPAAAFAAGPYTSGQVGADVSSPQCGGSNPGGAFGVVGVTSGTVYSQNSCLATEAGWYSGKLSLFMNTGLNADPVHSTYYQQAMVGCNGDVYCAAYNYGYNAGVAAYTYASGLSVSSTTWWLDVETANTWNADTLQNQKSLQGSYDALHAHGATNVGVYSTTAQWNSLTNSWQNNWINWGATTVHSASQAAGYCTGHNFTGGATWLIQYLSQGDKDYAC